MYRSVYNLLTKTTIAASIPIATTNTATIVSLPFLSRSFLLSTLALVNNNNHNMSSNTQTTSTDVLKVKLLSENATMPTKGSPLAAGFDLASAQNMIIPAGKRDMVKTDLSVACPEGTYARIAPRSGLAKKKGIDVGAGVIDADYRGPVGVILFNFGEDDFEIKKGDRIAQMILEKVSMVPAIQVESLDDTERGAAGFGSTGVSKKDESAEAAAKKQRTVSPAPGGNASEEKTN